VLYLIRHGETASNAARIVQTPETPLNEVGIAQAERLGRRLAAAKITRIVSSDLTRAAMTAEAIRTVTGLPIELDPDLQERNYGDVRGLPYAEVAADILAPDYEPPGGESWSDFHARVERAWSTITLHASDGDGHLAIVTHGLVCYSLARHHLQLPAATEAPLRWRNTSVTIIDIHPPWPVRLLNCTAHLDPGLS
jgi:probable phosphoglycerate mutase